MPLPSGISQPFDSSAGVKRPTKIEALTGPPPPVGNDTEGESSTLVCITSAVLGTYGPYLEYFSSTSFNAVMLTLNIININSLQVKFGEIQLALGAAGFEVPMFDPVTYLSALSGFADNLTGSPYCMPCNIPSGSRVSARFRQVSAGSPDGVCMYMTLLSAP